MASIDFGDGKIVELSKDTTKRLRDELLNPQFFDVHNFRVSERRGGYYSIAIGINSYHLSPEPDNNMDKRFTYALFNKKDAQKIVNNLQKLIDNLN